MNETARLGTPEQKTYFNPNSPRWMKQLGSEPLSPEQKTDVLEERAQAKEEYLLTQAEFSKETEFTQLHTITSSVRYYMITWLGRTV